MVYCIGGGFMGFIYKISNDINDKIYIGQTTKTIEERYYHHLWCTYHKSARNYNCHLYKAIRKYGKEHFVVEAIEQCEDCILNDREVYWIKHFDSMRNGYNLNVGGGSASTIYDEDVMPLWGKGLSLQEISKELNRSAHAVSGKLKASGVEESAIRKRGGDLSRKKTGKTLYRYDIDGNYIDSYLSRNDVLQKLGISRADRACRNHTKAGGYYWSYNKMEVLHNDY